MKHATKRITVILLLMVSFLLTSCKEHVWTIEEKMDQTAEEIMEVIVDEDSKALFKFFASDIQDNRKEETLEEIQQAFDFIDGKIVSYDYHPIPGRRSQNYGNIDYFDSLPEFRNVTTDLGKIYIIECTYHYIWKKRPEREGLCYIKIYEKDNRENKVEIGKIYYDD